MISNSGQDGKPISKGLPVFLSGLAVAISLVAAVFTGLQWRESHNLLLLSMKPSVDFELLDDPDDLPVGIDIQNSGPGPATIKSITYYADKKLIGDMDKLLNFTDLSTIQTYDFEEGDTLAVGEHHFLLSYKNKPHGKGEQKTLDKFVDLIDHHLGTC
ncbi:MAG: hypothetical protein ABSE99_16690 [Terracidiphilus sp.]|jgi:hypothetical protein